MLKISDLKYDCSRPFCDIWSNTVLTGDMHIFRALITRRMAIANGTCVSFCNHPKAHYLATSRESRRYVVAGAGIWLRQESPRHILASPGYAPGTIAINLHGWKEDSMLVKYIAACRPYASIFNSLRAIAIYWSEIATFSYPLAFNTPVRSGPWDNRGKCHTMGKRIQCL